jgi:hypothetical protein
MSDEIKSNMSSLARQLEINAVNETVKFVKDNHSFEAGFSYNNQLVPLDPYIYLFSGNFFDSEVESVESAEEGAISLKIPLGSLLNKIIDEMAKEESFTLCDTVPLVLESLEKGVERLKGIQGSIKPEFQDYVCDTPNCVGCPPSNLD